MLYSTKRKWEKLIHNNSASTSGPQDSKNLPVTSAKSRLSSNANVDLKKRKIIEFPGSPRPSVRAVSPTGSISSSITTTASISNLERNPKHSTYAPWDRDAFLKRLGTFRFVDKWLAKPAAVNEVAWAKRGWICSEKNRVRCNSCRKEVLVEIESDDEHTDEGRAIVQLYEGMITSEHEVSCLWKHRGSDDTIYRLQQLRDSSSARIAFTNRYLSLSKIRREIPPSLTYPERVSPASLHYPPECTEDGPVFEAAVILALFGWQNEDPGIPGLVSCGACFRRLGLWLFTKKLCGNGTEEEIEASVCRLDVVGEHRDYCPWINSTSQGKEAGWSKLMRILKQSRRLSGATSIHSVASVALTDMSVEAEGLERDVDMESKFQKLKRLKSMYFGKRKKTDVTEKKTEGKREGSG